MWAWKPRLLVASAPIVLGLTIVGCGGGASAHTHGARLASDVGDRDHAILRCANENGLPKTTATRRDLATGPLIIPNGHFLAHAAPHQFGAHGSYKIPFVFAAGATVTVLIEPPARRYTIITSPQIQASAHRTGAISVTYHACAHWGFFPQNIAFTNGRTRGCVPLQIQIASQPRKRRLTLDLFKRTCAPNTTPKG
jgi:hypothetical protein